MGCCIGGGGVERVARYRLRYVCVNVGVHPSKTDLDLRIVIVY